MSGALGVGSSNHQLVAHTPQLLPAFRDTVICQVAAGAAHTVALTGTLHSVGTCRTHACRTLRWRESTCGVAASLMVAWCHQATAMCWRGATGGSGSWAWAQHSQATALRRLCSPLTPALSPTSRLVATTPWLQPVCVCASVCPHRVVAVTIAVDKVARAAYALTRRGRRVPTAGCLCCGPVLACATDEGRVYAWGSCAHGQLGLGIERSTNVPTSVFELRQAFVAMVWAGREHSLALLGACSNLCCRLGVP